jgi:hypothetical protein
VARVGGLYGFLTPGAGILADSTRPGMMDDMEKTIVMRSDDARRHAPLTLLLSALSIETAHREP